jgi:hypothetical protein
VYEHGLGKTTTVGTLLLEELSLLNKSLPSSIAQALLIPFPFHLSIYQSESVRPIIPRKINLYHVDDMSMPSVPNVESLDTFSPSITPSESIPPGTSTSPTVPIPVEPTTIPEEQSSNIPTLTYEPTTSMVPSEVGIRTSMPNRTLSPTISGTNEIPAGSQGLFSMEAMVLWLTLLFGTTIALIR